MRDLALVAGAANGHLADRRLGDAGQTVGVGITRHRPTAGVGLIAQGHAVGLVGRGFGAENSLPVGRARSQIADHHGVAKTRIVIVRRYAGRIVGIIAPVTRKDRVGILGGKYVCRSRADDYFLGAIGRCAITHQDLVILGGVDAPAVCRDQP